LSHWRLSMVSRLSLTLPTVELSRRRLLFSTFAIIPNAFAIVAQTLTKEWRC
jgi:hypothetical protein